MAKVYLETSFFSACVTGRRDVRSRYWKDSSIAWLANAADEHRLYISPEVISELSVATFAHRDEALALTAGCEVLMIDRNVLAVAEMMIKQKSMPGPLRGDAIHMAAAAVHGMDYVLSWNVKHLANPNKRIHLAKVLALAGHIAPLVVTPDLI